MNIWDILILLLLAAALLRAFLVFRRSRSSGTGCGCGCEGCTKACAKKRENSPDSTEG